MACGGDGDKLGVLLIEELKTSSNVLIQKTHVLHLGKEVCIVET